MSHQPPALYAEDKSDQGAPASTPPAVAGLTGTHDLTAAVNALDLSIDNGTVDIKAAGPDAKPQAVWEITANGGPNAAPADTLQLYIDQQPSGKLKIYDKYTGSKLASNPQIHLTLTLPATVPVDASLGNGKLNIDSNAKLSASLGNGTLTLAGSYPASDVSVGNGTLKGDVLLSAGKHDLSVGNGTIDLGLRSGSDLVYSADSGMGTITLGGLPGKVEHALVTQSASGKLGSGAGKLDISIGHGSVKLHDASGAAAADSKTA